MSNTDVTSIKFKEKDGTKFNERIDWRKIEEDEECREIYNTKLAEMIEEGMTYEDFCDATLRAGKSTSLLNQQAPEGWFVLSEDILMPAIKEKNDLLHTIRHPHNYSTSEIEVLKTKLTTITKRNNDLILKAKARWLQDIATKISSNMKADPRTAWENVKILKGGDTTHHKPTINMAMRKPDGSIATNAKENLSVFVPHFSNVLDNERITDKTVLDLIPQRPKLRHLDKPITIKEVNKAINKLKKGKAPGLDGVPPEALKAMNPAMRREILRFISDFFEGEADYEGWHKSRCVPVPKKGDLANPNKWRGIMLMEICSKVLSSIMTARAFKLLKKHGTRFQFGGTPGVG